MTSNIIKLASKRVGNKTVPTPSAAVKITAIKKKRNHV